MLEPFKDKYRLTKELVYKDITVPVGYFTDGISYKLRMFALFINRFDPRYIKAAIVHDYLTDLNDWEKANQYFEELLPNDWRKPLMVSGVKIYRCWLKCKQWLSRS